MTPASSITSRMAVTLASSSGSTPPPGTIQWSGRREDETSSTCNNKSGSHQWWLIPPAKTRVCISYTHGWHTMAYPPGDLPTTCNFSVLTGNDCFECETWLKIAEMGQLSLRVRLVHTRTGSRQITGSLDTDSVPTGTIRTQQLCWDSARRREVCVSRIHSQDTERITSSLGSSSDKTYRHVSRRHAWEGQPDTRRL